MTVKCFAVANQFLVLTNRYNGGKLFSEQISMTCKRLQKLLYFCEVEYLRVYGVSLFEDDFHAWPAGPAIPELYDFWFPIQSGDLLPVVGGTCCLRREELAVIQSVFDATALVDTYDLVELSKVADGPWACVFVATDPIHSQVISLDSMLGFYGAGSSVLEGLCCRC